MPDGDDTADSAASSVCVIINPSAGRGRGQRLWASIRHHLRPTSTGIAETLAARPGQAMQTAERASRHGADVIVAIGGDGTLNEALNGLMRVPAQRRPALLFVPAGTANIFARALGLPTSAEGAAGALLHGARKRLDAGEVNGRYYATIAGAGFDAEVVALAARWPRWGGSKTTHVAGILATLATYRPPLARVVVDGREQVVPLTFLAAANTDWYGGGLHIAPGALADDGRLAVVYAAGLTRQETLAVLMRAFSGRHLAHPKVTHAAATEVRLEGERPLAIHADGEWIGRGAATFRVVPAAFDLIVPPAAPAMTGQEHRP